MEMENRIVVVSIGVEQELISFLWSENVVYKENKKNYFACLLIHSVDNFFAYIIYNIAQHFDIKYYLYTPYQTYAYDKAT